MTYTSCCQYVIQQKTCYIAVSSHTTLTQEAINNKEKSAYKMDLLFSEFFLLLVCVYIYMSVIHKKKRKEKTVNYLVHLINKNTRSYMENLVENSIGHNSPFNY